MSGVLAYWFTRPSCTFQMRSFLSKLPDTNWWSFLGWKSTDVTQSVCVKMCRHSARATCQSRTDLSMEAESRKFSLFHDRSITSAVWSANRRSGTRLSSFTSPSASATSSTMALPSHASGLFAPTTHTITTPLCPADARYSPLRLNLRVHTGPSCACKHRKQQTSPLHQGSLRRAAVPAA